MSSVKSDIFGQKQYYQIDHLVRNVLVTLVLIVEFASFETIYEKFWHVLQIDHKMRHVN